MYGLGMQELLVILAIVMLLFGGKKLPEVGRNLGKAIRGFRQAEDETMRELRGEKEKADGNRDEEKAKPEPEPEAEGGEEETDNAKGGEKKA